MNRANEPGAQHPPQQSNQRQNNKNTEQLTTLINNVNNTQIDLELNNAKELYKQNIREGNLTDGFTSLFGILTYDSYGFLEKDNTRQTMVDRFANVFRDLYDFYLKHNKKEAEKTSLVTFILKVSDFTDARLDPLEVFDPDYQGLLAGNMVHLLEAIIIETGTFYDFTITPVDINVIIYKDEDLKNYTSLAHHLHSDLSQDEKDDFYHRIGQHDSLSAHDG